MPYIGKSPTQAVRQKYQYTATASQTTFSGSDANSLTLAYTDENYIDVTQNGVMLKGGGNDTTRFQLDATVNPGNSGGPIVDKLSGSLVGVAVTKLNKDFTKAAFGVEGENTNYGIKASQVKDFLEANNLKVSFKKSKFKISDLENSTVFIYNK